MPATLSRNPILRIAALCVLYFAQGIPFGFVSYALVAWLAERGVTTEGIATVSVAATLPWAFKWAWGPIVDRFQIPEYGRRRPWIIFAQTMMILTAFTIALVPDPSDALKILAAVIFIHNLFSGLQDVAVDALAVDLLRPEERGRANGFMYGSKYVGTAVGAAGLGLVLSRSDGSLMPAVLLMMGLLAAIMCVPIFIRERPGERTLPLITPSTGHLVEEPAAEEHSENASVHELFRRLLNAFGRRSTLIAALLALLIWLPNGIVYPVSMTLFMGELEWTQEAYTSLTGTWGLAAGLAGAVLGGLLADLIGARTLAGATAVLLGGLLALFGLAPDAWWQDTQFVSIYLVSEQGLQGTLSVSLFAIFMSVSWKLVAATQFTAYMAMLNLSQSMGNSLSPTLEWLFGDIRTIFLVGAVIQILVVLTLPFCRPWKDETGTPDSASTTPSPQHPSVEKTCS